MKNNLDIKYEKTIEKKFKIRETETSLILFEFRTGLITEMNETARWIWHDLDGRDITEIIANYAERYGISMETAEVDVTGVLDALTTRGALQKVTYNHGDI